MADLVAAPAPRVVGPISFEDIIRYAGASGDFHPLHHDESYARACGYPTIFAMGMFVGGMVATYAADSFGAQAVRRMTIRMTGIVWVGDSLVLRAAIQRYEAYTVVVALSAERASDDVVVGGSATFQLPPPQGV